MTSAAPMRLRGSFPVLLSTVAVPSRVVTLTPAASRTFRHPLCSSPYSTRPLSRPTPSRSAGYPLLAVGVSLIAAQQLLFHSSAQSSATASVTPTSPTAASPSSPPSSSASSPSSPPPRPTFDLTSLPYPSKQSFLHGARVRLYQYQTCPFCNKVRAYLDYHRIPYELVEVNPMNKKEIAFTGLKGVPVVSVDDVIMHESSSIVAAFDQLFKHYESQQQTSSARATAVTGQRAAGAAAAASAYSSPSSSTADADEERWRQWVDSHLIFLTAPNLYTSLSASLQSMDYIMSNTSLPLSQRLLSKYVGGPMMYLVTEFKLKKKRGITDARAQLFAALRQWDSEAVQGRSFRGGDRPDVSDLAVFGVCRAMMGFPVGDEMMDGSNTSRGFISWYERMEAAVGPSAAKGGGGVGGVGADFIRVASQPKVATSAS
jgi:microsomal prostaglandin-E synthase 2